MIGARLPRRIAQFLAVLAALAALGADAIAFAEDVPDVFRLRAFDRTAMIEGQAEDGSMKDVPMRARAVQCLVLTGTSSSQFDAAIAADGTVEIPRAKVPQGATLTLKVEEPGSGIYVAPRIDLWTNPTPDRAEFVRMATSSPLFIPFANLVVTGQDVGKPSAYVRVNVIAQVANPSSELWTGPRDGSADDALRFPVPTGFTMVSAKRGNEDVECNLVTDTAGRSEAVISGGMFPPQTQSLIRIVLTGKWEADARYDLSFRAPLDIAEWNLVIDPTLFSYDASADGGTLLQDGGMRPGVNGIETRVWMLREIRAGTPVSQVFVQGLLIDPKVWRTIAIFVLTAAGAVFLARALAAGRNSTPVASGTDANGGSAGDAGADDDGERSRALAELQHRRKRGEITEFEFNARRAILTGTAGRRAAPAKGGASSTPSATPSSTPSAPTATPGALEQIREIEARAGTADAEQLRADVRTLSALLRERLRK